MSVLASCKGVSHPSEAAELVDVDVTPVMNMFIILIPFLVSMAVFTQLSMLSFSVPSNVSASTDLQSSKPKLKLTIVVAPSFLGLTVGATMLDSIPAIGAEFNFDALARAVETRRSQLEIKDEVVIAVRDEVRFQNMVKAMDVCKKQGFVKIGVSNATENPDVAR